MFYHFFILFKFSLPCDWTYLIFWLVYLFVECLFFFFYIQKKRMLWGLPSYILQVYEYMPLINFVVSTVHCGGSSGPNSSSIKKTPLYIWVSTTISIPYLYACLFAKVCFICKLKVDDLWIRFWVRIQMSAKLLSCDWVSLSTSLYVVVFCMNGISFMK